MNKPFVQERNQNDHRHKTFSNQLNKKPLLHLKNMNDILLKMLAI